MSDFLPQKALIKILLLLPVKSLVRFTLVCKTWQAFITSPDFIAMHMNRFQYYPNLFHKNFSETFLIRYYSVTQPKEIYEIRSDDNRFSITSSSGFDFPLKSREAFYQTVGGCNGVLCLCDDSFGNYSSIVLWNPSIRKHVLLPLPIIEPESRRFVLGFGFDLQRNDYKVVRVLYFDDEGFYRKPIDAEVFSLRNKSWTRGDYSIAQLKSFINDIGKSQAFVNGIIHWMAYKKLSNGTLQNSILSFDCSDDEFIETLLPEVLADPILNPNLHAIVHEGCLGIVSYNKSSFKIWEMKFYGLTESWSQLYCIDWNQLYQVPLDKGMAKVIGFRNRGHELLITMVDKDNKNVTGRTYSCPYYSAFGKLVSYNLTTKQVSQVLLYGVRIDLFCVLDYVDSLSLLDHSSFICPKEEKAHDDEGDYSYKVEASFDDEDGELVDVDGEASDDNANSGEESDGSWVVVSDEEVHVDYF